MVCTGSRRGSFWRETMPAGRMTSPTTCGEELPVLSAEELGGLEEGVGSEDGGDDLPSGVDGAFAV